MGKFDGAVKIGLRNKESEKLIAVYPFKPEGNDAEVAKTVRDWYYQQDCHAEEELKNAYVDVLTEDETKLHK